METPVDINARNTASQQPAAQPQTAEAIINQPVKQLHLPGQLPGQKPTPEQQNRKPILEIKHITKRFETFTAVNDVDLTVYQGEIFTLLG